MFAFAIDFEDEGAAGVLDNIQHRSRVDGVSVAAAYHDARDIFPHNPRRTVHRHGPGRAYFHPSTPSPVPAHLGQLHAVHDHDVIRKVAAAAQERGIEARAWIVALHLDAERTPVDLTPQNAFGDHYGAALCPSHPLVADYVTWLIGEAAATGVEAVDVESLHHHPFDHPMAHERRFIPLSATNRFLLGLCFCSWCKNASEREGVDAERLQALVGARLRRAMTGMDDESESFDPAPCLEMFHGELARFLSSRELVVTSLAARAAEAARACGAEFSLIDTGHSLPHENGCEEDQLRIAQMTQGVDLREIANHVDELAVCVYTSDPAVASRTVGDRLGAVAGRTQIAAIVRPSYRGSRDPGSLKAVVDAVRLAGASRLAFYAYGVMPLGTLDDIAASLVYR